MFRTSRPCRGFSIRRTNWKSVLDDDDFKMITSPLKKQIKKEYDEVIASRVRKEKAVIVSKWMLRKDYDAMLKVVEND